LIPVTRSADPLPRRLTRSRTAATGLLAGSARKPGRSRSLRRRNGTPPRWPTARQAGWSVRLRRASRCKAA